jgi:hypothetical protein
VNCYSLENLVEIRAAGLSLPEVEQHVEICEGCGARWELAGRALEKVTDAGSGTQITDRLRDALLSIPAKALHAGLTEVVVDAEAQPDAGVFIRGAATSMPRQRLYETGDHDIDLSLNGGGLLQGQVLPLGDERESFEGAYCLLYDGANVRCGALSACGEFELSDVSSGPFDLVIESPTLRWVLRGIRFDDNLEGR